MARQKKGSRSLNPRASRGRSAERDTVERYCPGLRCPAVYHHPDHWSGYDRIQIHIEGSKADMLRHGLLCAEMIEERPFHDHETWDNRSRALTINWLASGFEVVISNYGETIKTVLDVLRDVRGKYPTEKAKDRSDVAITPRDMLMACRVRPRIPEYLRLVVDNSRA